MTARQTLHQTHPSTYFPPVKKLAFHDLTINHKLPPQATHLLGLGLKFIPTPRVNITPDDLEHSTTRFERDMNLKIFFAGDNDTSEYDPKALRIKSSWRPPLPSRDVDTRICTFIQQLNTIFKPTNTPSNLTLQQQRLLQEIKQNKNITILSADKGLGPVGVDTTQYINWALAHLNDTTTYTILSEDDANEASNTLYHHIVDWTIRHHKTVGSDPIKYIRHHIEKARADPFGYFYLLPKLHKQPLTTRPVCSDCASLPHALGKWVDRQLQPIVRSQPTYFKNSLELKTLLDPMHLPPNACLFTYDAISMYTNIDTTQCLHRLTSYLEDPTTSDSYPHISPTPLVEALHLVMKNNRMKFGDIFAHQHKGIAMGMSPAPTIANLFVGIYEQAHIPPFPITSLAFLKRFIDDGFGIWLRHPDPEQDSHLWHTFQSIINNMGLQWEFTQRSNEVTFMDLTLRLHDGRITTSLYAKPLALHLYIPPFSCHTPGLAHGLIHGHIHRIITLCSHQADITREISAFYRRLLDRGYSPTHLFPLFLSAETKANARRNATPPTHVPTTHPNRQTHQPSDKGVFFHLQYHPANPDTKAIQNIWRTTISTPLNKHPLQHLFNQDGCQISVNRLTVAYRRAPNLGNILSCRVLRAKLNDFVDLSLITPQAQSNTHTNHSTHPTTTPTTPPTRTS